MAAAGYDVGQGDTWAVNEFPSSVRRGLGKAREDRARSSAASMKATAVRRRARSSSSASCTGRRTLLYKTTMKSWLGDAPFWLDMQRTVRFWAQEVYGDAPLGRPGRRAGSPTRIPQ